MAKILVSLLLVVTQVVPWTASPLFLCVGSDGSICVDGGPAACTCCCDHEEDACCSGDNDRHEHGPARVPADSRGQFVSDDDCDCAHILVSHDARVVRRMRVGDDTLNVAPLLATFVNADGADVTAPTLVTCPILMGREAPPLPPSERAPIVLRC